MPTEKENFFKKTFGEAKCARLQNATGRYKGNIYRYMVICVFIYTVRNIP